MTQDVRPISIRNFGLAYAIWIVSWIADAALRWRATLASVVRTYPETADNVGLIVGAELAVGIVFCAVIGWLVWRRPNSIARWIAIVILALAMILRVVVLVSGNLRLDLVAMFWLVGLLAAIFGMWSLFSTEALGYHARPATSDDEEQAI